MEEYLTLGANKVGWYVPVRRVEDCWPQTPARSGPPESWTGFGAVRKTVQLFRHMFSFFFFHFFFREAFFWTSTGGKCREEGFLLKPGILLPSPPPPNSAWQRGLAGGAVN